MNTARIHQTTSKVIPIHTQQSFYHWMSKSINRLKKQGNTSRLLILGLIVWNIALTVTIAKPIINSTPPQFDAKTNQQIINEEAIPPNLKPIPVSELA